MSSVRLGRPLRQRERDGRHRFTHVGRAQEEGTVRPTPCDRCARKGYGDTCTSLPGERCGHCVWGKVAKGDGC
jgi:hypothetical protein